MKTGTGSAMVSVAARSEPQLVAVPVPVFSRARSTARVAEVVNSMPWRLRLILSALVLSVAGVAGGQGYEGEPTVLRPAAEPAEGSPQEPTFVQPSLFAQPAPGPANEKAEPEPPPEISDLGAMAGGAAGTGAALPTLQGDTTWGGRPAYPHVIAPAIVATVFGIPPVLNDGSDRLVFQSTLPGFLVDSNSLPKSLKSADLVFGLLGFPLTPNVYLPFGADVAVLADHGLRHDQLGRERHDRSAGQGILRLPAFRLGGLGGDRRPLRAGSRPRPSQRLLPPAGISILVGGSLRDRVREDLLGGLMVGGGSRSVPGTGGGDADRRSQRAAGRRPGDRQRRHCAEALPV